MLVSEEVQNDMSIRKRKEYQESLLITHFPEDKTQQKPNH